MTRTRVLHVLPDLARGECQTIVRHLAVNRDADRFDVQVARIRPPDPMRGALEAVDVDLIRLDVDGLAAAFELARHVRHRQIDVIHVHSDLDRKVGQTAALLTGRPVVGHLHTSRAHLEATVAPGSGRIRTRWLETKAGARRAIERRTVRHYLATGEQVAASHVGRVDAPIAIVPHGIDTTEFRPRRDAERRQLRRSMGIAEDAPLLVCVGRPGPNPGRGQEELLGMVADLPGAHLVLVGGGDQWLVIQQLARWLDVAGRVHVVAPRQDIADLVGAADLFVSASASDGLPVSVIQSMASGVPVVTYDAVGLRSLVTSGVDGCLVPEGDSTALTATVRALLDGERGRSNLALAARATAVRRFDAKHMARSVEAVYDLVLGHDPLDARRSDGHGLVATR